MHNLEIPNNGQFLILVYFITILNLFFVDYGIIIFLFLWFYVDRAQPHDFTRKSKYRTFVILRHQL